MAEERAKIEAYMNRFGLDEKEAQVTYHLDAALHILSELYEGGYEGDQYSVEEDDQAAQWFEVNIMPHFTALWDRLGRRVLARDYPQSLWADMPFAEEEDDF